MLPSDLTKRVRTLRSFAWVLSARFVRVWKYASSASVSIGVVRAIGHPLIWGALLPAQGGAPDQRGPHGPRASGRGRFVLEVPSSAWRWWLSNVRTYTNASSDVYPSALQNGSSTQRMCQRLSTL